MPEVIGKIMSYTDSEKAKEYKAKWYQDNKEKVSEINERWRKSEEGQISRKEYYARRRKMKYIPIFPNIFPKEISVDGHHIDDWFVIPLPSRIHKKTVMGIDTKRHRKQANNMAKIYYGMNPEDFLRDDCLK
jgi:hypothetical protein